MKLYIVRHGETDWTVSGRHTGTTELVLTARGRAQAQALSATLAAFLGDGATPVVMTSPRLRAIETARLAMAEYPYQEDHLVREIDYGDFEGLTPDEISVGFPSWRIWDSGCPNGETVEQAGDRADCFLAKVQAETRPVIVFTHGHMSRILAARALGLEPARGDILASTTGSVSIVETHRGRNVIRLWNYISG